MTYRVDPIEVPEDNAYQHDVLQRRPVVEFLTGLIQRAGGPFVLAIDSPYGTGKTTLVNMLRSSLTKSHHQCIYFNAWQLDYVTDPLVAMVSALDQVSHQDQAKFAEVAVHLKTLRKVTTVIAKRSVVAAVKVATLGALDVAEEVEAVAADMVGGSAADIVEAFQKESEQLAKFREELKAVVAGLPAAGKKETLVFFVDELDRCRPTFAIELLERMKHLFDVPGIVFVLSVDKLQLEASTAAVYGSGINAREYLRKFIDLEYGLPHVEGKAFTEMLLKRFDLDDIFAERNNHESAYDREHFVDFFSKLADLTEMSLRTRERCIARMKVVLDQTPSNHYLDSVHVALLIVLRTQKPELYNRVARGQVGSDEVMDYLANLPNGKDFVSSREGIYLEALLIESTYDEDWKSRKIMAMTQLLSDTNVPDYEKQRYEELRSMLGRISRGMRMSRPILVRIASKIDLAAGIKN